MPSVRERNATPLPFRSSRMRTRCESERPRRSSFQTTSTSPARNPARQVFRPTPSARPHSHSATSSTNSGAIRRRSHHGRQKEAAPKGGPSLGRKRPRRAATSKGFVHYLDRYEAG